MAFTPYYFVGAPWDFIGDDGLDDRGFDLNGNGDAFWDDLEEEEYKTDALACMRNVDESQINPVYPKHNQDINPEVHVHTSILKGVNRNRKIDLKMNALERRL